MVCCDKCSNCRQGRACPFEKESTDLNTYYFWLRCVLLLLLIGLGLFAYELGLQ